MATKQKTRNKRSPRKAKAPTLRTQNQRLERELEELRKENRLLRKSLGAIMFKNDPKMMDLLPEHGVFEPSLADLIAELEQGGK